MAKPKKRTRVTLVCSACKARNYKTSKSIESSERIELSKFCPTCRKHTLHRESR